MPPLQLQKCRSEAPIMVLIQNKDPKMKSEATLGNALDSAGFVETLQKWSQTQPEKVFRLNLS